MTYRSPETRKPLFEDPYKRLNIFIRLCLAIVILWGLIHTIHNTLVPLYYRGRAEAWLEALEQNPDKRNANRVFYLIDNYYLTKKQAERAMTMLLQPKYRLREEYPYNCPADTEFWWSIDYPFKNCGIRQTGAQLIHSDFGFPREFQSGGHGGSTQKSETLYEHRADIRLQPKKTEPITFSYTVPFHFDITAYEESKWWAAVQPAIGNVVYSCDIPVPISIDFVAPESIPPIPTVSNPVLDASMAACFELYHSKSWDDDGLYEPGEYVEAGDYRKTGNYIYFDELPVDVAFRVVKRAGGKTHWKPFWPSGQFAASAGSRGALDLTWILDDILLDRSLPPGNYDGEILLLSDPTLAYQEPCITEIWDGTLTFPIKFRVE